MIYISMPVGTVIMYGFPGIHETFLNGRRYIVYHTAPDLDDDERKKIAIVQRQLHKHALRHPNAISDFHDGPSPSDTDVASQQLQ